MVSGLTPARMAVLAELAPLDARALNVRVARRLGYDRWGARSTSWFRNHASDSAVTLCESIPELKYRYTATKRDFASNLADAWILVNAEGWYASATYAAATVTKGKILGGESMHLTASMLNADFNDPAAVARALVVAYLVIAETS